MWILLGEYYVEENFGDLHLHTNVFLGVFDNVEDALAAKEEADLRYETTRLVVPEINKWK